MELYAQYTEQRAFTKPHFLVWKALLLENKPKKPYSIALTIQSPIVINWYKQWHFWNTFQEFLYQLYPKEEILDEQAGLVFLDTIKKGKKNPATSKRSLDKL